MWQKLTLVPSHKHLVSLCIELYRPTRFMFYLAYCKRSIKTFRSWKRLRVDYIKDLRERKGNSTLEKCSLWFIQPITHVHPYVSVTIIQLTLSLNSPASTVSSNHVVRGSRSDRCVMHASVHAY